MPPPGELRAGVPASWTITVPEEAIDLTVAWGDGSATHVGFITTSILIHVYATPGTYFLTFTAKDRRGAVMSAGHSVFVK
jgi:hypothetical protein